MSKIEARILKRGLITFKIEECIPVADSFTGFVCGKRIASVKELEAHHKQPRDEAYGYKYYEVEILNESLEKDEEDNRSLEYVAVESRKPLEILYAQNDDGNKVLVYDYYRDGFIELPDFPQDGSEDDALDMDYSEIYGCETLEDVMDRLELVTDIIEFNESDFSYWQFITDL